MCDHVKKPDKDKRGALVAIAKPASNKKVAHQRKPGPPAGEADLPFADSVGYQIRATHRLLQRFLQVKIEPHGIALWHEDGLTQRELSNRVGTMEPTTLSAILIMERKGLVRRVRNKTDRRKWHIHLTPKGRALKAKLLPLAREVVETAVQGLSRAEVAQLLNGLAEVQTSLTATLARLDEAGGATDA
jgi:DNA-binding MarR family transcriptional regulator